MKESNPRPLLWERAMLRLLGMLRVYRVPLLVSAIVGLLSHMFVLTNKLVNHDEVAFLFGKGGTLDLGRWGLEWLVGIFPDYSMPWLYGVLTLALVSAAVCILISIFSIRSPLLQGLLAGCVLSFPTLTASLSYMFTVGPYALSFLTSVLAVWLMERHGKMGWGLGLLLMVFSLSIYQAYIAVTASLLILLLIQKLLRGADTASMVRLGFCYVGFLAASLGIYYLITQLVNLSMGLGFSGYADSQMQFGLAMIPGDILDAYLTFVRYFSEGYCGLIPSSFSRHVHALCMAAAACLAVLWAWRFSGKEAGRLWLLAGLAALLPLAINCMHLFSAPKAVHTLMLYSFVAVYLLAVILVEAKARPLGRHAVRFQALCRHVLTLGMALVIAVNIYTANEAYLQMGLRYENTYGFYTALAAELRQDPAFQPGAKLALVGEYREPGFYYKNFYNLDNLVGVYGFAPTIYSKERFLEYYLGLELPFATAEEVQAIAASPEFAEMAVYPCHGSLKEIGGCLVVKLSQN